MDFSESLNLIVALVAGSATFISALLAASISIRNKNSNSMFEKDPNFEEFFHAAVSIDNKTPEQKMREHLEKRIEEAAMLVKRYSRESTINKISNGLLAFGQYVVGVALTSSFLQSNLTPILIGIFGVVVLISTAIHNQYRPDLKKRVADAKKALLRSTIRNVQDELATNDNPPIVNIIKRLTKTLNRIEIEESDEWITEELSTETDKSNAKVNHG